MNDLVSEKSIIVINKIDLGIEQINDEIKKYNEIDCLTMKDILVYLRNNNI